MNLKHTWRQYRCNKRIIFCRDNEKIMLSSIDHAFYVLLQSLNWKYLKYRSADSIFTICLPEPGFFLEYEISECLRDTRLEQNNTIVPRPIFVLDKHSSLIKRDSNKHVFISQLFQLRL